MHVWAIQEVQNDGDIRTIKLEAETPENALSISGIPSSRVAAIKKVRFAKLSAALEKVYINLPDQVLALTTLSGLVGAGQSAEAGFQELLKEKHFKKFASRVEEEPLVSGKLKLLGIDQEAVLVVEAGERSSNLAEGLTAAANMLTERQKINSELSKGVFPSMILFAAGLSALVVLPLMFRGILEQFNQPGGLSVETTFATDILFAISDTVLSYGHLIIAAIFGLVAIRERLEPVLTLFPVYKLYRELQRTSLAVRFLTAYLPLYQSGVSTYASISHIKARSRGRALKALEDMLERMQGGQSFSRAVESEHWPSLFHKGLRDIEMTDYETRTSVMKSLKVILVQRATSMSSKIARSLYALGGMLAMFAIFLMAYGAMMPLMSVGA